MKKHAASSSRLIRTMAGASLILGAIAAHAQSSQLVTLQNFGQKFGTAEIDNPVEDLLTAADGTFYGLFGVSGSSIFHMTATGAVNYVTALSYTDPTSCYWINGIEYCYTDYYRPTSLIQGVDSNLYTSGGDYYQNGNIFRITATGQWGTFAAAPGSATGPLVQGPDGKLYGVSFNALFSTPTTGPSTTLHTFSALDAAGHNQDGFYPLGGLTRGADGNYYGTTSQGGVNGVGTLFKVSTAGVFTKLRDFDAATGSKPEASLILANDGNFYGTTLNGGSFGNGVVFRLTAAGVYSVVHSFSYAEGVGPAFRLVESDKGTTQTLYGTTGSGGANNAGTLYSYTTAGKFAVQHSFSAADANGINVDGVAPNGLTVGDDGDIYGTTKGGGTFAKGTAFELITQDPTMMLKIRPATVSPYQNATLTWNSTSTTACTAKGAWSGSEAISGTQVVSQPVKGTYSYKLQCFGPYGSVSKTATLTVK